MLLGKSPLGNWVFSHTKTPQKKVEVLRTEKSKNKDCKEHENTIIDGKDLLLCKLKSNFAMAHRCKAECVCEACRNTSVSMERVCSLSSPESSLSTSSFASNSLQSSPSVSPCKRPNR